MPPRKLPKYRSDRTPVWTRAAIDGPGVWASCVKGREKQSAAELCRLFDQLANELWPAGDAPAAPAADLHADAPDSDSDGDAALDVEGQIAREVAKMKRPRTQRTRAPRFVDCPTNTPCVVFISCKPPVDPIMLVETHIANVQRTGLTVTRNTHRLVPVAGTCVANVPEIHALCARVLTPFFGAVAPDAAAPGSEPHGDAPRDGAAASTPAAAAVSSQAPAPAQASELKSLPADADAAAPTYTYKIELRVRNHSTLDRPTLIRTVAACVPVRHRVALDDPTVFVLVEVFKGVCGIGIVRDYYARAKFNVQELASARIRADVAAGGGAGFGAADGLDSSRVRESAGGGQSAGAGAE